MADASPRIALVGAVAAAAPPAERAFAEVFPRAQTWNVLDDRLISDALDAGEVTPPLAARMTALIDYALAHDAAGVLLTCSMYGPVAHAVAARAAVPVLAADDAAFEDAASGAFARIALVASLPIPLADARTRFDAFRADRDPGLEVVDVLAADAAGATDATTQAEAIERALRDAGLADGGNLDGGHIDAVHIDAVHIDAVLLAQYSISPAAAELARRLGIPVLAGPARAAARMRAALEGSTA